MTTVLARAHARTIDQLIDAVQYQQLASSAVQEAHGHDETQWPDLEFAAVERHRARVHRIASELLRCLRDAEAQGARRRRIVVALGRRIRRHP